MHVLPPCPAIYLLSFCICILYAISYVIYITYPWDEHHIPFNPWGNWFFQKTVPYPNSGCKRHSWSGARLMMNYLSILFLFYVLSSRDSPMSFLLLISRKELQGLLTAGCGGCRHGSWAPHTAALHHRHLGHSAAGLAQSGWSKHWALWPGVSSMWMWGHIQQACMGDAHHQLL